MFSVGMKATGPEGFSKAVMVLQPSDRLCLVETSALREV